MRRVLLVAGIALILVGCGPPRLDLSSEQSAEKSAAAIRASLDDSSRAEFDRAMIGMVTGSLMADAFFRDDDSSPEAAEAEFQEKIAEIAPRLHGKTAREIIAAADRLAEELERKQKERERQQNERERRQALIEIAKLTEEIQQNEENQRILDGFQVLESQIYKDDSAFSFNDIGIYLRVKNDTGGAIQRVFCQDQLTSPGRSVPWHEGTWNYEITGGLEAGETDEWRLEPNFMNDLRKVELKNDMVYTVEPVGLVFADGTEIEVEDLIELYERLDALRKAYAEPENGDPEI
jgi:hypothetical protein